VTADIDLHVVEPSLTEIFWDKPGPTPSGGTYDGDADQECKTTSAGHKEVVHWAAAPSGVYTVLLDLYDSCNAASVKYTVTIADAKTTLPPITSTLPGPGDHGNAPPVTVKVFSYTGSSFALNHRTLPEFLLASIFRFASR
jgi:hypothetical protein